MAQLRSEKYVNNLPAILTANTIYYVKTGVGFDMYITNDTGTIVAFPINMSSLGAGLSFQDILRIKTILNNI